MVTVQTSHDEAQGRRPVLAAIGLFSLVVAAVIGADPYRVRERVIDSIAPTDPPATSSQSDWKSVVTLRGTGATTASPFSIDSDISRWRVRWSCEAGGRLVVQAQRRPLPMIDAMCPNSGAGFASQTGMQRLEVTAEGPWRLDVEKQEPGR